MNNEEILELGITPNQYFLAECINSKRKDLLEKILTIDSEDKIKNDLYKLYIKGYLNCELCEAYTFDFNKMKVDKLFQKKLEIITEVKNDIDINNSFAKELYELFPKGIKSGNDPVRSGFGEFEDKLTKYIKQNPHHNKDTIKVAFESYLNKCKNNDWKYIKKAGNFISKIENGTKTSVLEALCEEIISNNGIVTIIKDNSSNMEAI